jgi:hypothetical protein
MATKLQDLVGVLAIVLGGYVFLVVAYTLRLESGGDFVLALTGIIVVAVTGSAFASCDTPLFEKGEGVCMNRRPVV